MRTAAISALGLLLAAGSAWAQSSYDDRDRSDRDDRGAYSSQSYDSDRYSRSSDSTRDRSGGWDRSRMRHHWSGHHGGYHGKSSSGNGASFYLKSGDKEFRVDCGDDDSIRECVDAALLMFREVQDTSPASTSASPTTSDPSTSTSGASGANAPGAQPSTPSGAPSITPPGAATGR